MSALLTARDVAELSAIKLPGGALRYRTDDLDAWLDNRPAGATGWKPSPRRTLGDYGDVLERDPCSYCSAGCEQVDHVIPLSRGGDDHWTNYTAACAACNRSKGAQPLLSWLRRGGRR